MRPCLGNGVSNSMLNVMVKKISVYSVVLACVLSIAVSCRRGGYDSRLLAAEQLMNEHYDSVLLMLDTLSVDDFSRRADKALFGMLYVMCLDKNHLDPKNDSLISQAVDYFAAEGDAYRLAMASYYLGRTYYHQADYSKAITNFFKAKTTAENNGYEFWAGMGCRGLTEIYNKTYNCSEELIYAQEEYNHLKKSGVQPYLNYALVDISSALGNNRDTKGSRYICLQLVDSAKKYYDPYLNYIALKNNVQNYIDEGDYYEAMRLLYQVMETGYSLPEDTLKMCQAMVELGNLDDSKSLMEITSDIDIPMKDFLRYKIAKYSHDYLSALTELEILRDKDNQLVKNMVSHNLTTSIAGYFEERNTIDEIELRTSRLKNCLILLIAFFLISVIVGVSIYIYRWQKRKIAESVLFADQLRDELKRAEQEHCLSTGVLKSLGEVKYDMLEQLCAIAYYSNDSAYTRKKITENVNRLLSEFSITGERMTEVEMQIDATHGHIMSDLRKDLPELKEADYRLFLFTILELSPASISLLLKEKKVDAVYNRKRRLKNKIKALDAAKRDRYLPYLN